jgi:hypothetical protein
MVETTHQLLQKTVEVVCFITLTFTKNDPASLTKNLPGSNIKVTLSYSTQKGWIFW